jgi:hypothetical protein
MGVFMVSVDERRAKAKKRCILGIAGKMRSGKTTLANHLVKRFGFKRLSFGTEVKREIARGMGMSLDALIAMEQTNKEDMRVVYQAWSEMRRKLSGKNYWVAKVIAQLEHYDKVVIDDVRYPNELSAIRKAGGHVGVLEITPDEQMARGADERFIFHESEIALDEYFWVPAFLIESDFTDRETVHDFVEWWLYIGGFLS